MPHSYSYLIHIYCIYKVYLAKYILNISNVDRSLWFDQLKRSVETPGGSVLVLLVNTTTLRDNHRYLCKYFLECPGPGPVRIIYQTVPVSSPSQFLSPTVSDLLLVFQRAAEHPGPEGADTDAGPRHSRW